MNVTNSSVSRSEHASKGRRNKIGSDNKNHLIILLELWAEKSERCMGADLENF